jgi:hypothetical protein
MTRRQIAAKVLAAKEAHPERYCSNEGCLWLTHGRACPMHPNAPIHGGRIVAGDAGNELALPEPGE